MKVKPIFLATIMILIVCVSTAICQDNSVVIDQATKEIDNKKLTVEGQLEVINATFNNVYRELNETKVELNNKLNADNLFVEKQIDLIQVSISNLSKEIDETKRNFSKILSTAMSSDMTQIGMFWSSMILVFITVMATYINYKMFLLQTDPDVVVYAIPDPNRPSIINLIIENIGKGVAKNIKFSSDKPIPYKAFGIGNDAPVPQGMTTGPFVVGIPELGPKSKRVITWGQYHGLLKGLGDEILTITANYSAKKVFIKAPLFKTTFFLDIKSFEGTDASDQNWDKKSAECLEKIAKSIEGIASSIKNKT